MPHAGAHALDARMGRRGRHGVRLWRGESCVSYGFRYSLRACAMYTSGIGSNVGPSVRGY
jgi:hypothetical protein